AFLEDRVLPVPQGQREAKPLLVVGDAGEAVLPPAVGAGPGLVVGEVVPGVAALAVVFANGAPLPFAQVRPPLLPGDFLLSRLLKPGVFGRHRTAFFRLERQAEHVLVMPRDRLKIRILGRLIRLAMVPGVLDTRQNPEVAFRIPDDPLLTGLV